MNHDLRQALLTWVQAHHIERYTDRRVLSHTEALEDLAEILQEHPEPWR